MAIYFPGFCSCGSVTSSAFVLTVTNATRMAAADGTNIGEIVQVRVFPNPVVEMLQVEMANGVLHRRRELMQR
ncbi:hypothetical protein GCM10023189_08790 [Nibrella saemangeumensis]|uniref:Uncharacterized protein n=1 Tax=Nibrella saemangeumensis TaxID=1084526 RepID=A0ABP8MEN1_9BACT